MITLFNEIKILASMVCAISIGQKNANSNESKENRKFIEDIRMIYASDANEARNLLPEGYELANSGALYYNGDGLGSTFLAIKPTDNVKKAITDIRTMNMVGGWSTSSYEEMLKSKEVSTSNLVSILTPAILDFRDKYDEGMDEANKGNDNGVSYASLILDSIYFDDKCDADGNPYTIKDLFLNESLCTKDALNTIFLQGNTSALHAIECSLLYSASALNDEGTSFDLQTFSDDYCDYEDCLDCDWEEPISDLEIEQMIACIEGVKDLLKPFVNSGFADNPDSFDEENIKTYLSCLDDDSAIEFQASSKLYGILAGYTYLEKDLVDFFLEFDTEDPEYENDIVKPFLLEMNEAQRSIVPFAGLETLFQAVINEGSVYVDEDDNQVPQYGVYSDILNENLDSLETKVSVFENVDRRIFNAEGIALTSNALRQNNAKNDFDWYVEEGTEQTKLLDKIIQLCCFAGSVLLGACALTYFGMKGVMLAVWGPWKYFKVFSQGTFSQAVKFWVSEGADMKYASSLVSDKSSVKVANEIERVWASKAKAKAVYKRQFSYAAGKIDYAAVARSCSNMLKVITVIKAVTVVATVAFAAALIAYIVKEAVKYNTEYIEYVDIPEMIADEQSVDGDPSYFYYTNVKTIDGKMGDLTQASTRKHSQWVALYYTCNTDCGDPIYADSLKYVSSLDESIDAGGVRKFGETSLYNLHKYTSRTPTTTYITYESIDYVTNARNVCSSLLKEYALEIMEVLLGNTKTIVEEYTKVIEACTTKTDINTALQEGMNALNKEKTTNYDYAYPVYQRIQKLDLNNLDEDEVTSIREAYKELTDEQKAYIENIEILENAEQVISDNSLRTKKNALSEEIKEYISSTKGLTSEQISNLTQECMALIEKVENESELENIKSLCESKVLKEVNANASKAGSIFGSGNYGLLFIGLAGGLVIGAAGLWIALYLLKKKRKEEVK